MAVCCMRDGDRQSRMKERLGPPPRGASASLGSRLIFMNRLTETRSVSPECTLRRLWRTPHRTGQPAPSRRSRQPQAHDTLSGVSSYTSPHMTSSRTRLVQRGSHESAVTARVRALRRARDGCSIMSGCYMYNHVRLLVLPGRVVGAPRISTCSLSPRGGVPRARSPHI